MDRLRSYASYDIIKNADIEGTFFVDADDRYHSSSLTVVVSLKTSNTSVWCLLGLTSSELMYV
jgi:hypothetical protein